MKKKVYLFILAVLTFTACKKANYNSASNTSTNKKYDCVCKTVVSYVDHCGADSTSQTNDIYSSERTQAESTCKSQNTSASSNSTITTKSCELL